MQFFIHTPSHSGAICSIINERDSFVIYLLIAIMNFTLELFWIYLYVYDIV